MVAAPALRPRAGNLTIVGTQLGKDARERDILAVSRMSFDGNTPALGNQLGLPDRDGLRPGIDHACHGLAIPLHDHHYRDWCSPCTLALTTPRTVEWETFLGVRHSGSQQQDRKQSPHLPALRCPSALLLLLWLKSSARRVLCATGFLITTS